MHTGPDERKHQELSIPSPLRIVWKREEVKPAPWDRNDLEGRIRAALGASRSDRVLEWTAPPKLVVVK